MAVNSIDTRIAVICYHKTNEWSDSGMPFVIARTADGQTVMGEMLDPVVGEQYRLYGEWEQQKNNRGPAFRFYQHEVLIDRSAVGIMQYLERYVEGVGRTRAALIVEHFGTDAIDALRDDPGRVAGVPGLRPGDAATLAKTLREHFESRVRFDPNLYANLCELFRDHHFPERLTRQLIADFGSDAVAVVRDDPYVLLGYPRMGWRGVDAFATATAGYPPGGAARQRAAVLEAFERISAEGHTYATRLDADAETFKLIHMVPSHDAWLDLAAGRSVVAEGLDDARWQFLRDASKALWAADDPAARWGLSERRREVAAPFLNGDAIWSLAGLADAEATVVERLGMLARLAGPLDAGLDAGELEGEQVEAAATIAAHGVCLLVGGAGTGKTWVVSHVIKSVLDSGSHRACVACPTGKAARRAAEALAAVGVRDVPCRTIHMTLKPRPSDAPVGVPAASAKRGRVAGVREKFRFAHNESDPIPYDYIFVDETSMVDVRLMASLLRAIRLGSRVLFVGDENQLPSVGPGAVLRDLIGFLPTARLTQPRRNAGRIVEACHAVKDGRIPEPAPKIDLDAGWNWVHIESPDPAVTAAKIVELHPPRTFDPLWETQVVSPQNARLPVACRALNAALADKLNPPLAGEARMGFAEDGDREADDDGPPQAFRAGDKVVRKKNGLCDEMRLAGRDQRPDWTWRGDRWVFRETGIVNGDMGQIVDVCEKKWVVVRFRNPDRLCRLPKAGNHLQLSYAITCHVAQGSGFPYVIVPVHKVFYKELFTREWLYTALSRGERLVVTIGEFAAIVAAVGRKTLWRRRTRLREKLAAAFEEAEVRS